MSGRVPKICIISVSIGKWKNPGEYREKVESVRVLKNFLDKYRKMVESISVPENGRIRVSTKKLYRRVPKNCRISVSTGKLFNPGENPEKVESLCVPKNCPYKYRKMVESV